jgi:outer membrane protein assembly factor BamE (lipoprotein component of BamABCDE complex)
MSLKPQQLLTLLALAFAGFTLLVTLVFFGWWAFKEHFTFGDQPFDPVRWMAPAAEQHSTCARGDMVLDIQHRLLQPGMPKSAVTTLLGRPAWEDQRQLEYELGICLWVVHGLRLYFDGDGHLTHSAIVQH